MASSNNVLRAGFTKKFRHIQPLGSLLSYIHRDTPKIDPVPDPNVQFNGSDPLDGSYCLTYRSWTDEYHVSKIVLGHRSIQATCRSIRGPSILICTQGKGTLAIDDQAQQVELGFVFFISSEETVAIGNSGEEELVLYRACCG
jgi:mannose-6-phosphate isomerase